MAISLLVYFPAELNLTSDDLMVWFGLNESAPAPIVVVVAEKVVVLVLHTEQRVERGSRNKAAAAAAAGSRLIGGRGRARLHCRVKLGFVKQRLEELCRLGMLPNSCWGEFYGSNSRISSEINAGLRIVIKTEAS